MFIIPREPDGRRRSKVYSNSKSVRSSKTSLLSSFTASTSGSGGSSSTITQESYNRSHKHRRRRTKDHRSRRDYDEERNRSVDVFDFLVQENARSKDSLSMAANSGAQQADTGIVEPEVEHVVEDIADECSDEDDDDDNDEDGEAIKGSPDKTDGSDADDSLLSTESGEPELILDEDQQSFRILIDDKDMGGPDPEGYYRSMSDSGISMGSGGSFQHPLPILHEEPDIRPNSRSQHRNELALIDPRWHWPISSPQPPHDGYIPPPCPQPPPAVVYDVPVYAPYPFPYPPTPYSTPPPPILEPRARDALAIREPKGQHVKPACFRSFSKISNRLLVRMQDDLAELEEELKQIEEEIDLAENDSDNSNSSFKNVMRDLKLREDEIHLDLHAQLDQYYHALEMMQKVDDMSQPAKTSDLPKHRQWLESRVLQPERIRRLISNDLRKVSTKRQPTEQPTSQEQNFNPQFLAYTAFINGVLPLIMFKIFSGVLNRLILLLTIIIIGSTVQGRMRTMIGKNELTCTLVCICISAFAAVFL